MSAIRSSSVLRQQRAPRLRPVSSRHLPAWCLPFKKRKIHGGKWSEKGVGGLSKLLPVGRVQTIWCFGIFLGWFIEYRTHEPTCLFPFYLFIDLNRTLMYVWCGCHLVVILAVTWCKKFPDKHRRRGYHKPLRHFKYEHIWCLPV